MDRIDNRCKKWSLFGYTANDCPIVARCYLRDATQCVIMLSQELSLRRITVHVESAPSSFRQPHSIHSPPGSPHPVHITSPQSVTTFALTIYHSHSLSLQI